MPLPEPKKTEDENEFVSRFVDDEKAKDEFPDKDQRLAVAYEKFNRKEASVNLAKSLLGAKEKHLR